MYADVIWDLTICFWDQKYQQNSKGNSTLECKNAKFSKLARSVLARIFIYFFLLQCEPFVILLFIAPYYILMKGNCINCICMQMYFKTWKYRPVYFWGARSLRSLAYMLHYFFLSFCRYIWGACPPPPYPKAGYATARNRTYRDFHVAIEPPCLSRIETFCGCSLPNCASGMFDCKTMNVCRKEWMG